jgi:hypothetical protein
MGRCPDDPTHLPAPVMQAHSCFKKACMIAALGHVRILPTDQRRDFALDPQTLASAMQASHVLIGRVMSPPPAPPRCYAPVAFGPLAPSLSQRPYSSRKTWPRASFRFTSCQQSGRPAHARWIPSRMWLTSLTGEWTEVTV